MGYRVFISCDMEGTAGIVSGLQVTPGQAEYETGRRLMTREINAAIEGALEAGASEIVVCDGHGNMQNIIPEELHTAARLVRGAIRDSLQMQGISREFDALFVTGAHAKAGTIGGVLDHSWVGAMVHNIRLNGLTLNEACLNAFVAGFYGVPLVMVSGDVATIKQTQEVFSHVQGAVVKEGYSRYSACSVHPEVARQIIKEKAKAGLTNLAAAKPAMVPNPLEMEIDYYRTDMADAAALVPGVKRLAARTIGFAADPETVFKVQELLLYRVRYEL